MKSFTLFFFLPLLFFSALFAESSVWKVTGGKEILYLGGTIHVLRSSDFPLPDEFDRAYALSDMIVFETDLTGTENNAFAAALAQKMFFPTGQTLSQHLKPETYDRLKRYLASQGAEIAQFDRLRPWAVVLLLTQTVLARNGIDQSGVDAYYSRRAASDGKSQRFLETPSEQLSLITRIGEGEEDAMISQTIREMEMVSGMVEWLVDDWRSGKTDRMERELVQAMKDESPRTYRYILQERNDTWLPKLIGMMQEGKKGFVLVGAMHLIGADGLLEKLKQKGYTVEAFHE